MPDKQRTPPINANSNRPAISSKCLENRIPRTTHTFKVAEMGELAELAECEELEQTKLLINFPVTAGHRLWDFGRMPLTFQPIQFSQLIPISGKVW